MWVDLSTSDLGAAVRFYGELFGWQAEDMGEESGHYTMLRQDGKMVAAVGPLMNPGQPTAWMTYFCTRDAAATAQAVKDAGGRVWVEPFAVMDAGSMAIFSDPAGGAFAVWQPAAHRGAELANTPNSFCWNELSTRDLEGAKTFYPRVFGWGVHANPMPQGGEYVEWQVEGRSIAGATAMGDQYPSQVPPFWLTYFAVADCDATASKAQQLGGRVTVPPMDIPQGRFAILSDPQGATFGVIRLQ
jgi:predicted enzyme related to lactoylglutathione lyase